jgi:hypothetical protein
MVGLWGCASATPIPDTDRDQLNTQLTGQSRYLRVSMYKGPFWGDENKVLLSDSYPSDLELFTDTHGEIQRAGAPTGVIPLGRRVKITQVEFPTALVITGRMLYSPRYNPWVYLQVEGEPNSKPAMLVLNANLKNKSDFLAALDRYLTSDDPAPSLTNYSDDVRKAILEKQVVNDMDPAAVEMAWGYPEHKHIDLAGGTRSEVWSYGNGHRTVQFQNNKVVKSQDNPNTPGSTPAANNNASAGAGGH